MIWLAKLVIVDIADPQKAAVLLGTGLKLVLTLLFCIWASDGLQKHLLNFLWKIDFFFTNIFDFLSLDCWRVFSFESFRTGSSKTYCSPHIMCSPVFSNHSIYLFLAALSSSRSLVVRWSVRWSGSHVCENVILRVSKGNQNTFLYLPTRQ